MSTNPSISVVIPTYNRAAYIRRCLECLEQQDVTFAEIVIVDASPELDTEEVAREHPGVIYLRNPAGRGNTPNSRNLALLHCTGEIIAFLDDDAFVHEGWGRNLLESFGDPSVGGVAGRAVNNQPGEAEIGRDQIGRLLPDGTLTGNFAADPGAPVEVDHMIGCNMAMRREVLAAIGGFRDDYKAGPFGICEETEACVRAKRLGYRLMFNPKVCATHIGAPQPGGRRFSVKYTYYHTRNNFIMLIRNFGFRGTALRFFITVAWGFIFDVVRRTAGVLAHAAAGACGLVVGLLSGARLLLSTGSKPARTDLKATQLSQWLSERPAPAFILTPETQNR